MGEGDTCTLGGLWEEKLVSHLPSLWQAPSDTISSFQLHNSTHPPRWVKVSGIGPVQAGSMYAQSQSLLPRLRVWCTHPPTHLIH